MTRGHRGSAAGQIRTEVSNRGPGAALNLLKQIDRSFVRESAARSELGAGLGLAIVDRIVRAHGGRLELKNRPEGGFVARVELPIHKMAAEPRGARSVG